MKLDFSSSEIGAVSPKKKKFSRPLKIFLYVLIFLLFLFLPIFYPLFFEKKDSTFTENLKALPLVKQIQYFISSSKKLQGERGDRINILLLGIGGNKHEGPLLTDTIILASYQPSTKRIALFSFPRDLLLPLESGGWQRLNSIYAFAEAKQKNTGGPALASALNANLDITIPYYGRIDFNGLREAIDLLAGVDIDVENTIDDPFYPIPGQENAEPIEARYERLYIEKGKQHMNGELALKYARSRHSIGIEGSDFSRLERQQKLLLAMREKILSYSTLLNPQKIQLLLNAYSNHFQTNLQPLEIVRLGRFILDIKSDRIIQKHLDEKTSQLQPVMMEEVGYGLIPANKDYSFIRNTIQNIFGTE